MKKLVVSFFVGELPFVMFKYLKSKKVSLLILLGLAFSSFGLASFKSSQLKVETLSLNASSDPWGSMDTSKYGATFRDLLAGKIKASGTRTINYKTNNDVLAKSDAALNGAGIIPFYHPDTDSTTNWNKEHVWPDSRGAGKTGPGSDPQMLRPADKSENSSRGNYFYGPNESRQWDPSSFGYYQARGEAARIIFYVATRYASNGLSLSNNPNDSSSMKTMGTLRYLVDWNNEYPVTKQEIRRNNYLHNAGFARNPFIDHPDWVNYIWDANGLRNTPYNGSSTIDPNIKLTLNKTSLSLEQGEVDYLNVTISGADEKTLVWDNESDDVISLTKTDDPKTVRLDALKEGTSTVTVYSSANPSIYLTCQINVTIKQQTSFELEEGSVLFKDSLFDYKGVRVDGSNIVIYPQGSLTLKNEENKEINFIDLEGDGLSELSFIAGENMTNYSNYLFDDDGMNLPNVKFLKIINHTDGEAVLTNFSIKYLDQDGIKENKNPEVSSGCSGSIVASSSCCVIVLLFAVVLFAFRKKREN
ncbi:MAG TPA: hypothetical protein DD377_04960 [Firmicutes bacterium]|nr:hypothetical protein [Bacillota bacterium]